MIMFKVEAQTSALKVADSLYTLGNYAHAINEYAKESSSTSKLQIARAYNAIGNYDKAILQYEDIIGSDSKLQIAQFELGKLLNKTGNFRKANALFYDLVSVEKGNPEYYFYLGETYREMDEGASSLVAYKNAVSTDSTHLRSLFQLGKYFVINQEKNQALIYLDQGLRFYSNDVSLINLKALALYNDYDYKSAIPLFERLLELGELKPHIYEKLGDGYTKLWEFKKAKKSYEELLNYKQSVSDAYNGLGSVYWKEKKLDSAAIFFKKAIEAKKPNLEGEYTSLAGLAREANDLKSALKYYRLAFQEDETKFMTYYQICTVLDQLSEDAKIKLKQYESFIEKFGPKKPYMSDFVLRRISELKEEIHFAKD